MSMDVKTERLVTGLGHPQAPDFLPNGDIIFPETYNERIAAWHPERGLRTFAQIGGAPNAVLLGDDDHVYFCMNGWTVGSWVAPNPLPPGVGRVKLDGTGMEMIFETPDGIGLGAAHDMTWGADGRLWFTDSGKFEFDKPMEHVGYVYAIAPDGSTERITECGYRYPAGIAAEKDGGIVWVECYSRDLRRWSPDGTIEVITTFPEGEAPEGLKIDAEGNYWIAFIGKQGVVRKVSPEGEILGELFVEGRLLNTLFGDDGSLYIIDFGMQRVHPNSGGSIVRAEVGVQGQPLFRGHIDVPAKG
jgi:gluconolactonase